MQKITEYYKNKYEIGNQNKFKTSKIDMEIKNIEIENILKKLPINKATAWGLIIR